MIVSVQAQLPGEHLHISRVVVNDVIRQGGNHILSLPTSCINNIGVLIQKNMLMATIVVFNPVIVGFQARTFKIS